MNLLMIAPLYDNKGNVRYYLGAQIDVTHLIEGGKGLESFEKLLANDRTEERYRGRSSRKPTQVLEELGAMMNKDELDAVNTRQRSESRESTSAAGSARNVTPARPARRVLGMDDSLERTLWPHPSLGPSGRLPGVYQNVSSFISGFLIIHAHSQYSTYSSALTHHYESLLHHQLCVFLACYRPNSWTVWAGLKTYATVFSTASHTVLLSQPRYLGFPPPRPSTLPTVPP